MAGPLESTCSAVRRADSRPSAARGCDSFAFTSGPLRPLSRLEAALGSVLVAKNPGQPRASERAASSIQRAYSAREEDGGAFRQAAPWIVAARSTGSANTQPRGSFRSGVA